MLLEAADETRLAESFQAHHASRGGAPLDPEFVRVCAAVVAVAGPEPGWDCPPDVAGVLAREGGAPELKVCRLWVEGADPQDELPALAGSGLWSPVRFLAYRLLAWLGRRTTLAKILADAEFELPEADGHLDASRPSGTQAPDFASLEGDWGRLLRAEMKPGEGEAVLREFPAASSGSGLLARHLASRAGAVLARLALSRRAGASSLPDNLGLPCWERSYLRALGLWQRDSQDAAIEGLRDAWNRNRRQTCTRLALSCALAPRAPEEALEIAAHPEATRDLLIHRAALLVRLGRQEEAREALATQANWEAVRYSWPAGHVALRRQEQYLATGLAEQAGRWDDAERLWRAAGPPPSSRSLAEARNYFIAAARLRKAAGPGWTRDIARLKAGRARMEIEDRPLTGDASFFRSAALFESEGSGALPDLLALRRRRAWREAELAAGGGRLLYVADALLRLGRTEDALALYRLLPGCAESVAVAEAWLAFQAGKLAGDWGIGDEAARGPWLELLASLSALVAGDASGAEQRLQRAEACGAPAGICQAMRSLLDFARGSRPLTAGELAALGLPRQAAAALWLLAGEDAEPARARAFFEAAGENWLELCPVDPNGLARRLADVWCGEGNWAEALALAGRVAQTGAAWGVELAHTLRARHALERAVGGELAAAEEELGRLSNGTVS